MEFTSEYWDTRYLNQDAAWDLGEVSPPIKAYADTLANKSLKILIPGGGNSWEAEYLHYLGFQNVFVVDVAITPLNNLLNRVPTFPKEHLLHVDFFDLEDTFDLIIEQTFFCALHPELRSAYVKKMTSLLKPNGKLVGLLFNVPLNNDRPPFGGTEEEYKSLFSKSFKIIAMSPCLNSVSSRLGRELFFELERKQ